MTNDEARQYFKDKGFSYNDITEGDILALIILLNKNLKEACKNHEMSVGNMYLSKKFKAIFNTNGRLKEGYLFVNGGYFTRRECISFNKDGFIGFAGWAADNNLQPIIKSFIEWCDTLTKAS